MDRIVLTNMLGIGGRPFTIPSVGNTILVNLGEGFDDPVHYEGKGDRPNRESRLLGSFSFMSSCMPGRSMRVFFAGSHVWRDSDQATTLFGNMDIYLYGNPDRAFGEFNLEQQEASSTSGSAPTGKCKQAIDKKARTVVLPLHQRQH